jgi:hypothetical protein
MSAIETEFNKRFQHWDIQLPREDVEQRRRGYIAKAGWAIWYLFGSDERGEYLDYYSSHRLTDDTHKRIYADGTTEELPSIASFRIVSHDPVEDAKLEAEYFARNQEVARMLEEKGFGMTGDEPGGVAINRYLHLNPTDK